MHFLKLKLNWQESWPWLSMVGFVVVSRWWLKSHYLFHLDSVQFALGLNHWDITRHQPHPPGYILYVGLGKLVNVLVHDPNLAFILIGIVATLIGLWAIGWLGNQWWGKAGGIIVGVLYVTNGSVWFHGLIAEVYIVETALILWVVALTYRYWRQGQTSDLIWLGLLLGLLGGIRQVGELITVPLVGYVVWYRHKFQWSAWKKLLGSLVIGNLLWLVPLLWLSGGVTSYWQAISGLWARTVVGYYQKYHWATPVKNFSLFVATIKQSSPAIFAILGLGALPYIAIESRQRFKTDFSQLTFWLWWVCPSLVLLLLVLITNPGYVLTVIAVFLLLGAGAITSIGLAVHYWQSRWKNVAMIVGVAVVSVAQMWSFFTAPALGLGYGSAALATIREADQAMGDLISLASHQTITPSTAIIVVDGGYLLRGFRHVQYYLPDFNVYGWYKTGWAGVSVKDDQFIYAHGAQIFTSSAQVDVSANTTKVIMLGNNLLPNANLYLSNLAIPNNQRLVTYFDVTNPATKQFLIDSKLFNFLNN
jgi:hypothetical protein